MTQRGNIVFFSLSSTKSFEESFVLLWFHDFSLYWKRYNCFVFFSFLSFTLWGEKSIYFYKNMNRIEVKESLLNLFGNDSHWLTGSNLVKQTTNWPRGQFFKLKINQMRNKLIWWKETWPITTLNNIQIKYWIKYFRFKWLKFNITLQKSNNIIHSTVVLSFFSWKTLYPIMYLFRD